VISIRFKSYLEAKQSFDRLFKNTAASPEQARQFENLAEVLMDAFREYQALQVQSQRNDLGEKQVGLLRQFREFPDSYVKAKHKSVPRKKLKWLKLSVEDYVNLTCNKVIGK
jgi:hypothetical protein